MKLPVCMRGLYVSDFSVFTFTQHSRQKNNTLMLFYEEEMQRNAKYIHIYIYSSTVVSYILSFLMEML